MTDAPKITLRKYQETAVAEMLKHQKACLEACCGAGKSIMIAEIARKLEGEKILMIVPSKELCEQNLEKLNLLGVPTTVYSASMNKKELSNITLGTPLSLVKEPTLDFDTIMIDEAQFCPIEPPQPTAKRVNGKWRTIKTRPTYWQIIDKVKPKRIYGFTGTPYRICTRVEKTSMRKFYSYSTIKHIGVLWKNMVCATNIVDLQNQGYLARTKYVVWNVDYSRFRFTTTGEIKPDDIEQFENETTEELLKTVQRAIATDGAKAKLIVFVNSIQYVDFITSKINALGFRAAAIHSKTKRKEREKAVAEFKSGDLQVIVNDTVVQVGFDSPNVSSIIWAKLTSSPNVYVQSIGRGLRMCEGKEYVTVYDMAGTYNKFGPIEKIESFEVDGNWHVRADGQLISGIEMKRLINRMPKRNLTEQ